MNKKPYFSRKLTHNINVIIEQHIACEFVEKYSKRLIQNWKFFLYNKTNKSEY